MDITGLSTTEAKLYENWIVEYIYKLTLPIITKWFSTGRDKYWYPPTCELCKAPICIGHMTASDCQKENPIRDTERIQIMNLFQQHDGLQDELEIVSASSDIKDHHNIDPG